MKGILLFLLSSKDKRATQELINEEVEEEVWLLVSAWSQRQVKTKLFRKFVRLFKSFKGKYF